MSSFTNKIDEWMKEAEERPESAVTIVRLIARRLRELSERDEELLAENIALQNGTRVEEYQKRIAHLEYQLIALLGMSSGYVPCFSSPVLPKKKRLMR